MTVFSFFVCVWFMMLDSPHKNIHDILLFFFFSFTFYPGIHKSAALWACTWLTMPMLHHDHVMDYSSALRSKTVFQKVLYQYPEMLVLPLVKFLTATPGPSCSRFQSEPLSIRAECIRFYWECAAKNTGLPGWKCILMGGWTQRHVMICLAHRVT